MILKCIVRRRHPEDHEYVYAKWKVWWRLSFRLACVAYTGYMIYVLLHYNGSTIVKSLIYFLLAFDVFLVLFYLCLEVPICFCFIQDKRKPQAGGEVEIQNDRSPYRHNGYYIPQDSFNGYYSSQNRPNGYYSRNRPRGYGEPAPRLGIYERPPKYTAQG